MMREWAVPPPGTRFRLPSGNVIEVLAEVGEGINCAYRRHTGDNKAARLGVTLRIDFLLMHGERQ
jgi:hypothetical protein